VKYSEIDFGFDLFVAKSIKIFITLSEQQTLQSSTEHKTQNK